jgi:hypothetical protein
VADVATYQGAATNNGDHIGKRKPRHGVRVIKREGVSVPHKALKQAKGIRGVQDPVRAMT